ncbi:MAG: FAD-dependent oxidoreductase [Labilithrix sp.]
MRIAIVGAGLAGLTIAHRLSAAGRDVTLIEGSPRLGGQLWSAREDGYVVELGAEGFIARSEAVPKLAHDIGLTSLLDQRQTVSFRYDGTTLHALAPGEAAAALDFQVARVDRGAGIRTFVDGMGALTDALAAAIEPRVVRYVGVQVEALATDGRRVRVDDVAYDAVVVAVPSAPAAELLRPLLASEPFVASGTVSSVNVSLAFARGQVAHPLEGTGFVVGAGDGGFRACTFASSKFAHRAPPDHVLLRAFFRPTPAELAEDTPWVARAVEALGAALGIEGEPVRSWTAFWPDALPVFDDAYHARVAAAEARLAERNIFLAGAAFHGSGIDAAVRSAERVAARLLER